LEVAGDVGYLIGRYNLPATPKEEADSGKYVMCLKRQRDGAWKLTADIWNSSTNGDEDSDEPSKLPLIS
jgi:ketosteroid isomerase-like protein